MAITLTTKTNGTAASVSSQNTASITPVANDLYLLAVGNQVGAGTPNTPTATGGGGLTWVQIATQQVGTTTRRVTLFRAQKPSGLSSGAVTIAFAGQTQTEIAWSITEVANCATSGTDGSGAIIQSNTNVSDVGVTSATVTLAAFADSTNNAAYFCIANNNGVTVTPESTPAFTELTDQTPTANLGLEDEYHIGEDTSITCTFANAKFGAIAIEIGKAGVTAAIGRASETDTAFAIKPQRSYTIGRATETDTARPLSAARGIPIGRATETDTAFALSHFKSVTIGRALETDTSRPIKPQRSYAINRAIETDIARALTATLLPNITVIRYMTVVRVPSVIMPIKQITSPVLVIQRRTQTATIVRTAAVTPIIYKPVDKTIVVHNA